LAQFKGLNGAPSFSPDGKNMLLTASKDGNPEIYLMNLASKSVQRLTNDSAIDTEARFAPDGKSFVFTSDRGGTPQIYRYNLDSGQVKRLTFNGRFNARGSLSKDGQSLALVHRQSGQQFQVGIMDLASGVISILTPTPLDESPSFSPNGQMVVYATRERGRGMLAIMSTDGRFRMNLPSESGEVREPAWAPALR
jgi:TolB protein